MSGAANQDQSLQPEILGYYNLAQEEMRLYKGEGQLERTRTQEILNRFLPPPPATLLDVGGGAGVYALWLARGGYEVHLVDATPLHVEQAREASASQSDYPLSSVSLGDARAIDWPDGSVDAVLLLGPLYHLTERPDRLKALREAKRVLRPDGLVFSAGISRFASWLYGIFSGALDDPALQEIVARDLVDGQHRNPSLDAPYFTTAFFHHPNELRCEVEEAGLQVEAMLAVEGPPILLQNFDEHWHDPGRRERLLAGIRAIEAEPSLLGVSAHLLAVGCKLP